MYALTLYDYFNLNIDGFYNENRIFKYLYLVVFKNLLSNCGFAVKVCPGAMVLVAWVVQLLPGVEA